MQRNDVLSKDIARTLASDLALLELTHEGDWADHGYAGAFDTPRGSDFPSRGDADKFDVAKIDGDMIDRLVDGLW